MRAGSIVSGSRRRGRRGRRGRISRHICSAFNRISAVIFGSAVSDTMIAAAV
jgi:hypothetical protein